MSDQIVATMTPQSHASIGAEANLWPNTETIRQYEPTELPDDILEIQAKYLAQQTEYYLKGFVRSSDMQAEVIYHNFYVYAPYVRHEPYKLFYVKHGLDPWKDVKLVWGDMGADTDKEFGSANGPEELRAQIKKLLSSDAVLRLIGNLVARSKKAKLGTGASAVMEEESASDED